MTGRHLLVLSCLVPSWACAQSIPPLAPPAAAGQPDNHWVRIKAPGADELWYDREKLVVAGNDITFWRRVNFAVPDEMTSLFSTRATVTVSPGSLVTISANNFPDTSTAPAAATSPAIVVRVETS